MESLQTTLAGVLVRTRLLASERAKPTIDFLPRLPDSLSVATSAPSDTFLQTLETELADRLNAAASRCQAFSALVQQLNRLGHQFSVFDEDGGGWQTWQSSNLILSAGYPDLHEIRSGELPKWDPDDRCFCDVAWVQRKPASPYRFLILGNRVKKTKRGERRSTAVANIPRDSDDFCDGDAAEAMAKTLPCTRFERIQASL